MEEEVKLEDCPHCGKCPVCGEQNNHYYHKHKPWTLYPCHPFHDGIKDLEEKKESGDKT